MKKQNLLFHEMLPLVVDGYHAVRQDWEVSKRLVCYKHGRFDIQYCQVFVLWDKENASIYHPSFDDFVHTWDIYGESNNEGA